MRWRRWIKRIVLGTVGLVLVGAAAFAIFLHTAVGRRWLRDRIVAAAKESLPGGLRIEEITGSVFGELTAKNVEIDALDKRPMLRAPAVRIELSLWKLALKTIEATAVVDDLTVYPARPAVKVVPDDPDADPFRWTIALAGVEVHRARVELDGAATLDDVELHRGWLEIAPRRSPRAGATITAIWRERAAKVSATVELAVRDVPVLELDAQVGGVSITGTHLAIDPRSPSGTLEVTATVAQVRALEPRAALPGDASLRITAIPAGAETELALAGTLAGRQVTGSLRAELAARRVRGVVTATDVDLALASAGALAGRGSATIAFTAERTRVRGSVIAGGAVTGAPPAAAVIGFDAALDASWRVTRATGIALASGQGDARARAIGELARDGAGVLVLANGRAVGSTTQLGAAIEQRAPIDGAVTVSADVHGPLDALTATGRFAGRDLVYHRRPLGRATGTIGLRGKVMQASVTAYPAAAPIVIALDGEGTAREIALGRHRVTLANGDAWTGRGGRITITDAAIALRGLRSANRTGRLDVAATYGRATQDLGLDVAAHDLPAAAIDPAYRGTASGTVAATRRGDRWTGRASLAGRGLAFTAGAPTLDADATLALDGRRITADATAQAPRLGRITVSIDADGPRDLTDAAAWRALERTAVRETTIGLDHVDLAGAGVPTGGVVDGKLTLAGADTRGKLAVSALHTPLGDADGDIQFRQEAASELGAAWGAHVVGLGDADVAARIAFPVHPFDPAAWRALGRGALSSLSARLADISIDPKKLAALGIVAPYRGTANVEITVERGSTFARVDAELAGITGGALVGPIDLRLTAETDERGTRGSVHATAPRLELFALDATLPITFDRWLVAPRQAIYAPLAGKLAIPELPAREVLALVGRTDLTGGTLAGEATVGGTLGTPTARGSLRARDLAVVDRIEHRTIPKLDQLAIEVIWGGVAGSVLITGSESRAPTEPPRTLFVSLNGRPDDRSSIVGHLDIKHFDLVPLATFLPGSLVGAQGTLDANLSLRGAGLATLRGSIALSDARVPLHPSIGTLSAGSAKLAISDAGFDAVVTGTLGTGSVALTAQSSGHELATVATTLTLAKVSPIGDLEPIIRGVVSGTFRRSPANQWQGELEIRDGSVELPARSGEPLLVAEAPPDLYFLDGGGAPKAPVFALGGRPPDRPWLIADLEFGRRGRAGIKVRAEDLYDTRGELAGKLRFAIGDSVGIDGRIDIVQGDVGDLVGRSYRAEGSLVFDGTTDPTLDITLAHRFPEMVLTAHLTGRLSNPDPPMFGGDPIYTQDQLAGFFLGGEPGGDPSSQTREAATGATASILSTRLGRRVRKALPVKLNLLRCEPGSSAVGASCSAGRWFGDKLFVTGKYRLVARPDENTGEVQVQYYLQRELLLEGVGGDGNHDGVDLLWRRRW